MEAPEAGEVQAAVRPASMRQHPRRIYPYSVLIGGASSGAELADKLDRDRVASQHYRGFNVSAARLERLERTRTAYVSYRMADRVYWTRKPVMLPAGEAVLNDGASLARARCGNRISTEPRQPVGPEVDLDTPEFSAPTGKESGSVGPANLSDLPQLAYELFPPFLTVAASAGGVSFVPAGIPAAAFPARSVPGFGNFAGSGFAPVLTHEGTPYRPAGPPPDSVLLGPPPISFFPIGSGPVFVGTLLTPPPPAVPYSPGNGGRSAGVLSTSLVPPAGFPILPGGNGGSSSTVPSHPGDPNGPPAPAFDEERTPPGFPLPPSSPPQPPRLVPPGVPVEVATETPEPATALLLAAGAILLAIRFTMR